MENASKALLIAGAILIAIVLISLGVMILGQGSESIKNNNMSESEIASYNSQFEAYLGGHVKGSTVKTMINTINAHNRNNRDDMSKQINVTNNATAPTGTATEPTTAYGTFTTTVGSGQVYNVTATYYNGGLIGAINYTVVSN